MKIDYIVNPTLNTKELVLIHENEAEMYQLKAIGEYIGVEYNGFLKFKLKCNVEEHL